MNNPDENLYIGEGFTARTFWSESLDSEQRPVKVDQATGKIGKGVSLPKVEFFHLHITVKNPHNQFGVFPYQIKKDDSGKEVGRDFEWLKPESKSNEGEEFHLACPIRKGGDFLEHKRNVGYIKALYTNPQGLVEDVNLGVVGQRGAFFVCRYVGASVQAYRIDNGIVFPDFETPQNGREITKYHRGVADAAKNFYDPRDTDLPLIADWSDTWPQVSLLGSDEVLVDSGSPRTGCWYGLNRNGEKVYIPYHIMPEAGDRLSVLKIGEIVRILDHERNSHGSARWKANSIQRR